MQQELTWYCRRASGHRSVDAKGLSNRRRIVQRGNTFGMQQDRVSVALHARQHCEPELSHGRVAECPRSSTVSQSLLHEQQENGSVIFAIPVNRLESRSRDSRRISEHPSKVER